jgi:hypothetical protein
MIYRIHRFLGRLFGRISNFFHSLANDVDIDAERLKTIRHLQRELAIVRSRCAGLEAACDTVVLPSLSVDDYIARLKRAAMHQESN